MYDLLSKISPRKLQNDQLDIVFLNQAGLELKFHVIRYGKVIYDADTKERLRFEERTQILYCDFRPILDEIDAAILDRIPDEISA